MSILLRIILVATVLIGLLGFGFLYSFTQTVGDLFFRTVIETFNDSIRHQTSVFFEREDFDDTLVLEEGRLVPESHEKFSQFSELIVHHPIHDMQVWSSSGVLMWSTKEENSDRVGVRAAENDTFQLALDGHPGFYVYEEGEQQDVFGRNFPKVLGIYVPVSDQTTGEKIGVVEVFFELNGLVTRINEIFNYLFLLVLSLLILIISVISIFVYIFAIKPLQHIIKRMEELEKTM